jgi:hypothetical protein
MQHMASDETAPAEASGPAKPAQGENLIPEVSRFDSVPAATQRAPAPQPASEAAPPPLSDRAEAGAPPSAALTVALEPPVPAAPEAATLPPVDTAGPKPATQQPAEPRAPQPAAAEAPPSDPLAALLALSEEERLALFT